MNNKFKVYAQVRATRQLAGDVYMELSNKHTKMGEEREMNIEERRQWSEIEDMLNAVECKLEKMNLKEESR